MKRIVSFILVLIAVFALCACGDSEAPSQSSEPSPTPTENSYEAVTYRNHGKRCTLDSMPEKILSVGPGCTELLLSLGLDELIVGKCMTNHSLAVLDELSRAYDAIPVVSEGYPTLGQILASGCDFVYATSWLFDDALTPELLEENGLTVYVSSASDYTSLWTEIKNIGMIFKAEHAAEKLIRSEQSRIVEIGDVLNSTEPVPVLVLDSFIGDLVYTAGGDNIETEYLSSACCTNIFSELRKPWDAVSKEEILEADPYYIVIHDYTGSGYDSKVEALKADPVLGSLDAVINGRFIRLPLENVMPGVRSALTVETVAHTVFPDAFAVPET